jgi:hypothetical protein
LRKDKINVLYCSSIVCHLAATAGVEFAGKGHPIMDWTAVALVEGRWVRD